eukprot:scaffold26353_cov68-Phaeocystis_antarctica.AAC.2
MAKREQRAYTNAVHILGSGVPPLVSHHRQLLRHADREGARPKVDDADSIRRQLDTARLRRRDPEPGRQEQLQDGLPCDKQRGVAECRAAEYEVTHLDHAHGDLVGALALASLPEAGRLANGKLADSLRLDHDRDGIGQVDGLRLGRSHHVPQVVSMLGRNVSERSCRCTSSH